MELWQLRYFVAVAEERSVTQAAARLHLTQPPLSAQLARLEAELGVPLLVRHRRGVDLTDAGQALLERARRLLGEVDGAAAAVRGVGLGHSGRLSLAFVPAVALSVLPSLLRRYSDEMPDVQVELCGASPEDVVQHVRRASADAGIIYLPPGGIGAAPVDRELDAAVIHREPLVAVLPRRLADPQGRGKGPVDLASLRAERFLLPERHARPGLHAHVLAACTAAGFRPEPTQEAGLVHTVLALVAAGLGVSLLPAAVHRWINTDVVVAPLRQRVPVVETAVVWRRAVAPPPVLARFLRLALSTPEPDVLGPGKQRHRPAPTDDD